MDSVTGMSFNSVAESGMQPDNLFRAVVDIGSNSVRLVVYAGGRRAPVPVYNEKVLCGLGRDIALNGRLHPDACARALGALQRFKTLLDGYGNVTVFAIATSAVRDSSNGAEFIDRVRNTGFKVEVISGRREAELAARGVIFSIPDADGIVADLGGGSLELADLDRGTPGNYASLAIGPLNLMQQSASKPVVAQKHAALALENICAGRSRGKYRTLYAVGGAWRAMARIHMQEKKYPLPVLHFYEMPAAGIRRICRLVIDGRELSPEMLSGIPARRLDLLPYACLVLRELVTRTGVERIVVSPGGIREGLLYDSLSPEDRKRDPLRDVCRFYARKMSFDFSYGDACFDVVDGLFNKDTAMPPVRVRRAVCQLAGAMTGFYPQSVARQVPEFLPGLPFMPLCHEDRIWMAASLYRRYRSEESVNGQDPVSGLVSVEYLDNAVRFGVALRFVTSFSPGVSGPLKGCRLYTDEAGAVVFEAPAVRRAMMRSAQRKRLEALGRAAGVPVREVYI